MYGSSRRDIQGGRHKFPRSHQENDSSLPDLQVEKFPVYLEQLKETITIAGPVAALIFVCIYRTEYTRLAL